MNKPSSYFEHIDVLNDIIEQVEEVAGHEYKTSQIKDDLSKCMVLPNQMIYATSYNPLSVFFSRNSKVFLGITKQELNPDLIISTIHEDDVSFVLEAIKNCFRWMPENKEKAKDVLFSVEYRIRKANNLIITVQRNTRVPVFDDKGNPYITISVVTEIRSRRAENFIPKAIIYNPYTGKEFMYIKTDLYIKYDISKRERDVMLMLCQGMTSKLIADKLFISKHTVDGHRRSLLEKTQTSNTTELVSFALNHEFVTF